MMGLIIGLKGLLGKHKGVILVTIHKRYCNECGKYYEGDGIYFCSVQCSCKNKDRIKKQADKIRGRPSPLKGIHIKHNDALTIWRENGGVPWNKGLKGIHLSPKTEFKKGHNVGENNNMWKGGVSSTNKKIRRTKKYKKWADNIYKRDYYTCQECGIKCQAGNIVAHHIESFTDYPELRFDVNNGVTLCRSCHFKLHHQLNKNAVASLAFS